jgi:hypothetical protein
MVRYIQQHRIIVFKFKEAHLQPLLRDGADIQCVMYITVYHSMKAIHNNAICSGNIQEAVAKQIPDDCGGSFRDALPLEVSL